MLGYFMGLVALLAPTWTLWPDGFINGITYFFTGLMKFNFIFPVDTALQGINFLASFAVLFFSAKLLIMLVNWLRGAGEIKI